MKTKDFLALCVSSLHIVNCLIVPPFLHLSLFVCLLITPKRKRQRFIVEIRQKVHNEVYVEINQLRLL